MPRSVSWSSDAVSEPTLTEALLRVKKELAGTAAVVVALGGGNWFSWDDAEKSRLSAEAVATHYVPALAKCEAQVDTQRKICLELVANERENTAQWRAQCGGP